VFTWLSSSVIIYKIAFVTCQHKYEVTLFIYYFSNELNVCLNDLQHFIADIRQWITEYIVNVNHLKTNIIYLPSAHFANSAKAVPSQIGVSSIIPYGPIKGNKDTHCLKALFCKFL